MKLDIFGVESDNIPTIDAILDFAPDTSLCKSYYYNPAFKPKNYRLSKSEMQNVRRLIQATDLQRLKPSYRVGATDQPTAITTIYQGDKKYVFRDYGLEGDDFLKKLYKIVFKY